VPVHRDAFVFEGVADLDDEHVPRASFDYRPRECVS
jgi:hypothetical protein